MHRSLLLAAALPLCAACGPRAYSSDIGVPGVPLEEGQLAGTWYGQIEFATIIRLPVFGNRNAGANGGRLLEITWHPDERVYRMVARWCWDDVFEVEGTHNTFTDETLHKLRPSTLILRVDDAKGELLADKYVDLWGVQNLPDPEHTDLPNKDNYQRDPQRSWMLDEDEDGQPGVTVHVSGSFNGEGHIVNRSVFSLDGVARTVDELIGLVPTEKAEQKMLDSNIRLAGQSAGDTDQRPDPDPKASWFQFIRGSAGATCADVLAARDRGALSYRRPF
ncbi:MAG: hypothetical protein HY904_03415 [Deltaproteobacteria bacterium]|nr:hypothetical protein [Deltaproteobacteria bacterium]